MEGTNSNIKLFWSLEGTSYNGLYEVAPLEKRTFFNRLQVHERVEISVFEVYERIGKSVISAYKRAQKGQQMHLAVVKKSTF